MFTIWSRSVIWINNRFALQLNGESLSKRTPLFSVLAPLIGIRANSGMNIWLFTQCLLPIVLPVFLQSLICCSAKHEYFFSSRAQTVVEVKAATHSPLRGVAGEGKDARRGVVLTAKRVTWRTWIPRPRNLLRRGKVKRNPRKVRTCETTYVIKMHDHGYHKSSLS